MEKYTVSANKFFLGTISLNDYIDTLDMHRSLFQEFQLDEKNYKAIGDKVLESFIESFTAFDMTILKHRFELTDEQEQAFQELYVTMTVDPAVGIDFRLPSPAVPQRYWVFHKNDDDRIHVAKAEINKAFEVEITMSEDSDPKMLFSSADEFSDYYWGTANADYFPNGELSTWENWLMMRKLDMHTKPEAPPTFVQTCLGKRPTLEMCSKLMTDPKVPTDHEIIPKCRRVVQNNAFARTMVIVIPVLVSILVLLTIVRCIFRQKRHRRGHLRELARIEAGNKMHTIIDDLTVIEVGKNDPPPIYADVVAVIQK
ncbi:Oidioi.mRNA.OKI2018_I69.chr1.g1642.t1.cds [Oikopleura dioica]|uniref:Oidioi.mRNA.OKI2018_I69.chr1.g1642.t1.cds n=1 Tax=Oikopleura dioica TaxID=34765 RepID=A0ABN7SVI8_OIKDI|nr:Oidioi.mRNA.OKI2018_I69.chr1.g1642.t1.cds [Oikopleura dioica]